MFCSSRVNPYDLFRKRVDGSDEAEQLTSGVYRVPTSVSSDGKTVIFRQLSRRSRWDIGMLRLEEDSEPKLLFNTEFNERTGKLSLDDLWLAYVSDESGRDEIYVAPFPGLDRRVQISSEGGSEPAWTPNGKELFYRSGNKMMAVLLSTDPELKPGRPGLLFEARYRLNPRSPSTDYDVSRDGKRFLMIQEGTSTPPQINVVRNWSTDLERLVPTNIN